MTELLKRAETGDLAALWDLILEAYHNCDDPKVLLKAVQTVDEFEIADEPNLLLHMAFVLRKGGYLASADEVLEDLIEAEYPPAMCTLAGMHLAREFIDHDEAYAYELLDRAILRGSLRARDVRGTFRWLRAVGLRKVILFFPAWYWSFRYKFAVNVRGRKDDTIR
ncbi:MAG: hypothetical protein ABJZ56_20125 [Paracoccaceae bacterium]